MSKPFQAALWIERHTFGANGARHERYADRGWRVDLFPTQKGGEVGATRPLGTRRRGSWI